jgi:sulfur-oxidizing protein SoxY
VKRREFVAAMAALGATGAAAQNFQPPQDIAPLIASLSAGASIERGGIEVVLPQIAENGNSVPMKVRVASPMTPEDRVLAIHILAERNPRPLVATFRLGPAAGRAEVSTRVRLAGTQDVTVLAELSGKRFRMEKMRVLVTSAACLDDSL